MPRSCATLKEGPQARARRLSLSQRERIKVRVCFAVAPRARARLLAIRCRAPGEPGDSKISTQRLHGDPGIPIAFGREFDLHGSYVHRRPVQWPALRWDSRNPRRNRCQATMISRPNFYTDEASRTFVDTESASPAIARNELLPVEGLLVPPKHIEGRAGRFFPAKLIIHIPFP